MRITRHQLTLMGLAVAYVFVCFFYLRPGTDLLIEQSQDRVMSDGTDIVAMPYHYDLLLQQWDKTPSRFFFGSVYIEASEMEKGSALWMPWSERFIVLGLSHFFNIEQLSTALTFVLMLLDALAMFALARSYGWSRSVSFGMGIAWSCCNYTRARAKVHPALVGIYHLPLIFLGLRKLAGNTSVRAIAMASLCFLGVCFAAHYYIVTSIFMAPFFFAYFCLERRQDHPWKKSIAALLVALLPAVSFLAWNFLEPLPADAKMSAADSRPNTGEFPGAKVHPFLTIYAAHPIDYFAGEIALQAPSLIEDWNPLRKMVSQSALSELGYGNAHEHTNGIRWSLWFLAVLAVISTALAKPWKKTQKLDREVLFLVLFGFFAFWLSLSPDSPFEAWGPSLWLQRLVSQIRVPARAGVMLYFSVLLLAGTWLHRENAQNWERWKKYLLLPGIFPILMLLDLPPLANMPMDTVLPRIPELQRSIQPHCGTGIYIPFINNFGTEILLYRFLQRMRGSDCSLINNISDRDKIRVPANLFPPTQDFVNKMRDSNISQDKLVSFARCTGIAWIAFDRVVASKWVEESCQKLGFKTDLEQNMCFSDHLDQKIVRSPDLCL